MSTSSLGVNSAAGAPITISGLASGLDTSTIIAALMAAEREPVTHLSDEQAKLQAEQTQLQSIQSSLQQLASAVSEFSLPSLFESSQTVTSNEPARVSATTTVGRRRRRLRGRSHAARQLRAAYLHLHEPASEQTITIDGHEFTDQGRRERQGTGERDQRRQQRDGLRGGARRREPWCCPIARPATRAANSSRSPIRAGR